MEQATIEPTADKPSARRRYQTEVDDWSDDEVNRDLESMITDAIAPVPRPIPEGKRLERHLWTFAKRLNKNDPTFEYAFAERVRREDGLEGLQPGPVGPGHWSLQLIDKPIKMRAGHEMIYPTKLMFKLEPGYALLFAVNHEWASVGLTLHTRIVGAEQNGREITLSGFANRNAVMTPFVKVFDFFLVKLAELTPGAKNAYTNTEGY